MLYKWLFEFSSLFSVFNLFQYITVRSFLSFFSGFFICLSLFYLFIYKFSKNIKEKSNSDRPASHNKKQGTPTMGGLVMIFGLLSVLLLWIDISQPLVQGTIIILIGFAAVGLWDDLLNLKTHTGRGLRPRWRLIIEFVLSFCVLLWLKQQEHINTILYIPFFKNISFDLGWSYLIFGSFVITGCANAVNLTDGLDGLACFPVMVCATTLAIFAYVTGHYEIANYLNIPFIKGAGELSPLAMAIVACCLSFLWYNAYPAQVFMGDIGSLSLGSFLGITAVLTKNEILLILLGGVFVAEALSVIFQIYSYKWTGRRLFKMAPFHHHFELKGIEESKIIVRFWIVSILLAVLSLAALKLR